MDEFKHWSEIVDNYPVLPWQEQVELARVRDEGGRRGKEALDKLILHNLRAVLNHVEKMNCKPELKVDLMSDGILGLTTAAERWKPVFGEGFDKPAPFPAYAFWYIKDAVIRSAKKNWHDDISMDGLGKSNDEDCPSDKIMGSHEDEKTHLDASVMSVLSDNERFIIEKKIVEISPENDESLAESTGLDPVSISKLFFRGIRKLRASA